MKFTMFGAVLSALLLSAPAQAAVVYQATGIVGGSGPVAFGADMYGGGAENPITDFQYNFDYVGEALWSAESFLTAAPTVYSLVLTLPGAPEDAVYAGPSTLFYDNFYRDDGDGVLVPNGGDDNLPSIGLPQFCFPSKPCFQAAVVGNQITLTEDGTVQHDILRDGTTEEWRWNDTVTLYGSVSPNDLGKAYTIQIFADPILAAVPEPATWAMFLIGFGAIGFNLRRGRGRLLTA